MLLEPQFIQEGWQYLDPVTEKWKLKDNAPDWAVEEFNKFYGLVNGVSDEQGTVTVH